MLNANLKSLKAAFAAVTATGFLLAGSMAFGQAEITVGTGSGPAGGTAVTSIDWVAGNNVSELQIEILYDDAVLTPQNGGGSPAPVNGCLAGLSAPHSSSPFTACVIAPSGRIVLTVHSNFTFNQLPTTNIGTITWDIAPGATVPSTEILTANELDVTLTDGTNPPPATVFTANNGEVNIVAVSANLNVQPPNLNFGNQQTGTSSAPQNVTISNDGTDGVNLQVSGLAFATGTHYSWADVDCGPIPFTLADSESCDVAVTFSPTADGNHPDTLTVTSDAGTVTNDSVALDGTGVPGPQSTLSVSPSPLAFGTVDLGDMPDTGTITAENTGDAGSSLTISSVGYAGDTQFSILTDNCTSATLNQGDTCTVDVQFNAGSNGSYSGTVSFSSNADTNPNPAVNVTGTADSVASLSVNPPFGPVNLGSGPSGSALTANGSITNSGSASGGFSCSLGGPDAAIFSTNPSPLSGTVPASDSVDFSISCNLPAGAADGTTYNATLTCSSPDDQTFSGTHDLSCSVLNFVAVPVPTLHNWALILMAMLMLIAGGLGIRFFRA